MIFLIIYLVVKNIIKWKLDKNVDKLMEPEKLHDLTKKVSTQTREKRKTAKHAFNGSFGSPDGVPSELIILINFIINGSNDNLELRFFYQLKQVSNVLFKIMPSRATRVQVLDTNGTMHTKRCLPSFMLA